MFRKILILTIFVIFSKCEEIQEEKMEGSGRIVGGQELHIDSVPYFCSIMYKKRHLCGCSIIAEQFVLTAAHCRVDLVSSNYKIRTGSTRKSRGGQVHKVSKVIPNPKYNESTIDGDFMLLQLENPMEFNEKQQPIELADKERMVYQKAEVLTSGFGLTHNEKESMEFLRGAVVTVSSKDTCNKAYPDLITENMFCAGSVHGIDSCQVKMEVK
jgi:trypsin